MILVLVLVVAIAVGFLVSPLIAAIIFVVGAVGYLVLYGMSGRNDESATSDPGSRAARQGRRAARNTRIR